MTESDEKPLDAKASRSGGTWIKSGVLVAVLVAIAVGYTQFGDSLSLGSLATNQAALRQYQEAYPALVFGLAMLVYARNQGSR